MGGHDAITQEGSAFSLKQLEMFGELKYISGRPCLIYKQENARYLLIQLTPERDMDKVGNVINEAAGLTDKNFCFCALELNERECVPLKAKQYLTPHNGRLFSTSIYSPDDKVTSAWAANYMPAPERLNESGDVQADLRAANEMQRRESDAPIAPMHGFSTGLCDMADKSVSGKPHRYAFRKGAMELLDLIEMELVPALKKKLRLPPETKVILGGHGMAGMFALWAGTMADSFYSVAAVSPAPLPEWWAEHVAQYKQMADNIYVSYGSDEVTPLTRSTEDRANGVHVPAGDDGAVPYIRSSSDYFVTEWADAFYKNDRLHYSAARSGGHNDNVQAALAEGFAWGMGCKDGLFIKDGCVISCKPDAGTAKIVIPDGVTGIAAEAFMGCDGLTEVYLPDSIREIGYKAFFGCRKLAHIRIPESLTRIGDYAFSGTEWENSYSGDFLTVNNILLKYKGSDRAVTVPDGITEIAVPGFEGCDTVEEVTLPESVVRYFGFIGCEALRRISIPVPNSRLETGKAFPNCKKLEVLTVGDKEYQIKGCTAFTEEAPNSHTESADNAASEKSEKNTADAAYEMCGGNFPHGGTRLIKTYLDENGRHTDKSSAVRVLVTETGTDGSTLFEDTMDIDEAEFFGMEKSFCREPAKKPADDRAADIDEVLAWVSRKLPPQPCIRFTAKKSSTTRFSSKLGGLPYYPKGAELPKDKDGRPLRLLAQLNFRELPRIPDFPEKGILQIFIAEDYMYGMPDDLVTQDSFRVIYNDSDVVDDTMLMGEEDLPEYSDEYGVFPFDGEYRLVPNAPDVMQPTFCDYRMPDVFVESYNRLSAKKIDNYYCISQEDANRISGRNGHQEAYVGGYPFFRQLDPRGNDDVLKEYDTVLFELCSFTKCGIEVMLGDVGAAAFLIRREDLKNLDFSRVLYNYDCC